MKEGRLLFREDRGQREWKKKRKKGGIDDAQAEGTEFRKDLVGGDLRNRPSGGVRDQNM